MQFFGREQVGLVEYQHHRDTVGFSGSKETVNESGGSLWIIHRDNQKNLIYVSRQDMALLGEIGSLTDHIVLTVFNISNEGSGFITRRLGQGKAHTVTHSHRIGTADTFQSEITLNL